MKIDIPGFTTEPIKNEAYDERVKINGFVVPVPFRVISEDNYQALVRAATAKKQTEWVSVDERLPGPASFVIARKHNGIVLGLYFNIDKEFVYSDQDQTRQVTHWMPLPSPPDLAREEKEGK